MTRSCWTLVALGADQLTWAMPSVWSFLLLRFAAERGDVVALQGANDMVVCLLSIEHEFTNTCMVPACVRAKQS